MVISGDYIVSMAAGVSYTRNRKNDGFMILLSSAACEWFLIFLLFLDAVFSYLILKFAYICELQMPCPLCSRLDHVLGKKKPGFYWSLICSNHREEVSSLVSCSIHGRLADVDGMCEECLMPVAMQKKSEGYRLLVGKLCVNVERSVLQDLMLNKNIQLGSRGRRTCSCCSKTWRPKSSAERLLELEKVGSGASKANLKPPLPRVPGSSRFSRRDSWKRLRDKFTGSMAHQAARRNTIDTLSHVGYTKLKISSDSESEVPVSEDDDNGNTGSGGNNFVEPEHEVEVGGREIPKIPAINAASVKQADQGSEMKGQADLLDLDEPKNVDSSSLDKVLPDHGLRELNWAKSYHKPSPSLRTDLISLEDVPQPSNVGSLEVSAETSISTGDAREKVNTSKTMQIEAPAGTSSGVTCLSDSNGKNLIDSLSQNTDSMELSCEHAVEPINATDSAKTEEEMVSLVQVSTSEVGGKFSKDTSPRSHDRHSESRKVDDSSSNAHVQLSTSEKGSLSPKRSSLRTHDKEFTEDEDSSSRALSQVSMSGVDGLFPKHSSPRPCDEHNESTKDEASSSLELSPARTSEVGSSFPKDTSPRPHDENNASQRDGDSSFYTLSQVSASELGGCFSKDTGPRPHDGPNDSIKNKDASSQALSRVSTSEVGGLFPKDVSLRPHDMHNESRKDEDHVRVPVSASAKRSDSSYEYLDGIGFCDIEGESTVDQLRRQVEHDRRVMNSLYKELEEERNAATVAANQAMAMITKLQEEKAALRTEALQYLRMMEEQAEYDMEALERANNLLAEREKDLQDLESELQFYRNNYPDESRTEYIQRETSLLENQVAARSENGPGTSGDSKLDKISRIYGKCKPMNMSSSNFEDEKVYISQFLKKLERELHQAYCIENLEDVPHSINSDKIKDDVCRLKDSPTKSETLNIQIEESICVVQNNSPVLHGNSTQGIASSGTPTYDKVDDCCGEKGGILSANGSDTASAASEKEISALLDRLEALEADQEFLKHASNLLWGGKDGLQLMQEVAYHLKQLRKIEFKTRQLSTF